MTDAPNPAHDSAVAIRERLERRNWTEIRVGHFRHTSHPTVAVEVGYVYGEVTVRVKRIKNDIDRGEVGVLRGVGEQFYHDSGTFIDKFLMQDLREREDSQ